MCILLNCGFRAEVAIACLLKSPQAILLKQAKPVFRAFHKILPDALAALVWCGGVQHLCLKPVRERKIIAIVGKEPLKPRLVEFRRLTFFYVIDKIQRNLLAVDGM